MDKMNNIVKGIHCLYCFLIISFYLIFNSCSSDYTENLGNGYFFNGEGGSLNNIYCEKSYGGRIPATVIGYDYDNDYIIAKQKPRIPQSILYEKMYEYKYGSDEYYYWIIVKDEYLVLGPFNLSEFAETRIKYKVPDNLNVSK